MKTLIAIILFKLNFKYHISTSVLGYFTYGYGKLDFDGYFEYEIPRKYINKYIK